MLLNFSFISQRNEWLHHFNKSLKFADFLSGIFIVHLFYRNIFKMKIDNFFFKNLVQYSEKVFYNFGRANFITWYRKKMGRYLFGSID